jgi:methionyl-tRNA formyltransferase
VRILTLGSDKPHPLTDAALAVVRELEWAEHVDHLTANDERTFLHKARSPEYREHVASLKPDLIISAAYARIVPGDVLAIPTIGAINVHPSLLPDYRGVCAVWWALYEGCSRVGVTVHEMAATVDTGAILGQTTLEVGPDPDPVAAWRELGDLSRPLLIETLEQIRDTGRISGRPQPEGGSYRGSPYTKEAARLEIDWSQPAEELARRNKILRGNIDAGRYRVYAKRIDPAGSTDRPPGTVLRRRPTSIQVAAGGRTSVKLTLVDPAKSWIKLALHYASTGRLRTVGSERTA